MSDARDTLIQYISERFAQEDGLLQDILEQQRQGGGPMMNIGPDQGKFLYLLVKLMQPKQVLELGSYYGYSSIWLARSLLSSRGAERRRDLPKLHCIEVSAKQCEILKANFAKDGLEDYTEVHQGSGIDLMQKFIDEAKQFDMVFVDADKANYVNYLDLAYDLLPSGGLLLVDNCFWDGKVLDSGADDKQTQSIRDFNDKLAQHSGFESSLVTIQDGLAFAVKT